MGHHKFEMHANHLIRPEPAVQKKKICSTGTNGGEGIVSTQQWEWVRLYRERVEVWKAYGCELRNFKHSEVEQRGKKGCIQGSIGKSVEHVVKAEMFKKVSLNGKNVTQKLDKIIILIPDIYRTFTTCGYSASMNLCELPHLMLPTTLCQYYPVLQMRRQRQKVKIK